MPENDYAQDLQFLRDHTDCIELTADDDARVVVTPAWQGRAMTSTPGSEDGQSFGWINYDFIAAGEEDPAFNNYGGEDRFWMGPEAGQFALWFRSGDPFDTDHWVTPPGFNRGAFDVTSQGHSSVAMTTQFDLTNYAGASFSCALSRSINLLTYDQVSEFLGATVSGDLRMVAFESHNTLANAGAAAWTRDSGLVSIWVLGQFKPLPRGFVIVPFWPGEAEQLGPKATTDYFGPVPPERCRIHDDHLLFACDGQFRSKIGISRQRARRVLGSFDPDRDVLTIVQFNLPDGAAKLPYVNSLWEMQSEPFAGDVVNSYNDGEEIPGEGQLGPFYEIETSSPAAELAVGESITHIHRTYHFGGDYQALKHLAMAVLGVDLDPIKHA
jgi:hypothetical protein